MARRTLVSAFPLAALLGFCALGSGARAQTVTYTHDALGRVVSAYYPDGTCLAYAYDAAGNRTTYSSSAVVPPVANPLSIGAWENLATTFDPRISEPICVSLTVSAVGTPSHGTASIVTGGTAITYTPSTGHTGTDSFTYKVTNGTTTSGNGTITVTTQAPTLPPIAVGGQMNYVAYIVPPQTVAPTIVLDVTPLISGPYGYALSISAVTQATHGAITYSGNVLTYQWPVGTPIGHNKEVTDSFTYTISDSFGHTATAVVAVSISVNTNQ